MGNLAKKYHIGNFDRKITFRQITDTQSTSGAMTETVADFATVWASVDSKTGNEKFIIDREVAHNKQNFVIRYRTDIDEKMIIRYNSKDYDILSINETPGTRLRFLEIMGELRQ